MGKDSNQDRPGLLRVECGKRALDSQLFPDEGQPIAMVVFQHRDDGNTEAVELFSRLIKSERSQWPRLFAQTPEAVEYAVREHILPHLEGARWEPYRSRVSLPNGQHIACFAASRPNSFVGVNGDCDLYFNLASWHDSPAWASARLSCRIGIALGIISAAPESSQRPKSAKAQEANRTS